MEQQDIAARQSLPPLVSSNECLRAHAVAGGIAAVGVQASRKRKHPVLESEGGLADMIRDAQVQEHTTQKRPAAEPQTSDPPIVVEAHTSGADIVGKFTMFRKG